MSTLTDRAKGIFLDALELAPHDDLPAFLDRACGGDAALRHEVDELLGHHARVGTFMASESPPEPHTTPAMDPPAAELPGAAVGPYRLLEALGEGGMGLVFVAEQSEPVRRRVAVKVIKPGMDSRQVVARFEVERQALALMDHPNIARVLDAGATPSGRPYFVMELVKGVPITHYCDAHRLTVRDRLGLFVQVCAAVQHAHQKGVIHRDLKPGNILVAEHDGEPVAKVIDFGVAKALGRPLTDNTVYTGSGLLVGTPLYMSPEQAGVAGPDVDTRADVYSLGVVLYELLTGVTPFDRDRFRGVGYDEVRRIIRDEEPPRPSTRLSTLGAGETAAAASRGTDPRRLGRQFRGDLDWVVMKALEKDRGRRYETVSAFAADVQRHLHDEPVQARPPSAGYRLRKFARRNRVALAAAVALGFVLLLGAGGLAANNVLVRREKDKAVKEKDRGDRHLARVRVVLEKYLADTAEDRRLKAAGLHDLRRSLLLSMVAILEEFAHQEGDDRTTRVDRGWALLKLGTVWLEVGEANRALVYYDRAREVWDRLAADFPDVPGNRANRADCDNNRGIVLTRLHRLDEAESALRQAMQTREQLVAEDPTVADYHSGIGTALHQLAVVQRQRHDSAAERRLLEQAIGHQQAAVRIAPKNREARTFLANHHGNLGVVLTELNQPTEAEAAITTARGLFEALAAEFAGDAEFRSGVAGCWINLGNLYSPGRAAEALQAYREAAAVKDKLAAEYPAVADYRRDLAGVYQNIGLLLGGLGRGEEARTAFDKCLALREQLVKEHPDDIDLAMGVATSLLRNGCQEADARRFGAAIAPLGRAVAILDPLASPGRAITGARGLLLRAHGARADALLLLGRHSEAVADYDRAIELDGGRMRDHFRVQRAVSLAYLGDHVRAAGEAEDVVTNAAVPGYLILDAAGVHAVCSAAAANDPKLSDRYAGRAVALLRRAFERNYQAIAAELPTDKKLDALRDREDFRKLLAEWEGKQKK